MGEETNEIYRSIASDQPIAGAVKPDDPNYPLIQVELTLGGQGQPRDGAPFFPRDAMYLGWAIPCDDHPKHDIMPEVLQKGIIADIQQKIESATAHLNGFRSLTESSNFDAAHVKIQEGIQELEKVKQAYEIISKTHTTYSQWIQNYTKWVLEGQPLTEPSTSYSSLYTAEECYEGIKRNVEHPQYPSHILYPMAHEGLDHSHTHYI